VTNKKGWNFNIIATSIRPLEPKLLETGLKTSEKYQRYIPTVSARERFFIYKYAVFRKTGLIGPGHSWTLLT
jgi:hypothetical protein